MALVNIGHVILDRIEPITRRVSSIRVYVNIAKRGVSLFKFMPKMMTDERVNSELSKVGFPNVLVLEFEKCGTGKCFVEVVGSKNMPVDLPSLKSAEKDTPQTRTDSQGAQWWNPNSFF